jgi:hypothetical protein
MLTRPKWAFQLAAYLHGPRQEIELRELQWTAIRKGMGKRPASILRMPFGELSRHRTFIN